MLDQRYKTNYKNESFSRKRLTREEKLLCVNKIQCQTPRTASSASYQSIPYTQPKPSKPKSHSQPLSLLFEILRYLIEAAGYSEQAYRCCLLLLRKYHNQGPLLLSNEDKLFAVAVFLIYSKAYEHRKVSLKQLTTLTNSKYSKERIIQAQAMVLRRLGFQVFEGVIQNRQSKLEIEREIRDSIEEPIFSS